MTTQCFHRARKVTCNAKRIQFIMKIVLLALICLSQVLAVQDLQAEAAADNKTCVLSQQCKDFPGHCGSARGGVFNPALDVRAPAPIVDPIEHMRLAKVCPMYAEQGMGLCCVADQANVMDVNFNSIDSVFGKESGTCGVNLKILWCHFTCDP